MVKNGSMMKMESPPRSKFTKKGNTWAMLRFLNDSTVRIASLRFVLPVCIAAAGFICLLTHSEIAHAQGNEINFVNSAGQRVGFWKLTGNMLHIEGYTDSQVVAEGHYFANMLDGVWNTYYPNGKFKSVISYKYGYRDGKSLLYYEDGTTRRERGNKKRNVLRGGG